MAVWKPLYRVIRFPETKPEREPQPIEYVDVTRALYPRIHPIAREDRRGSGYALAGRP